MSALRRRFHAAVGLPFSMHVAESRSEISCLERRSGRLAALLRRRGFYPPRPDAPPLATSLGSFLVAGAAAGPPRDDLVHSNYLSDEEMRAIAEDDRSTLVICPGTRAFHGVTTPAARRARRRGVPLDRIQEALRHRDASSTKLYAKLAKGGVLDLLRRPAESLACRSLNPSDATARIHRDKWRGGRDSNPQGCKCPETQGSRPVSRVCPELIRVWELRDMVANWLSS